MGLHHNVAKAILERTPISEPWLMRVLEVLVKKREGAVLDVGANMGQTLVKFLALNTDRGYYGFEPNAGAASVSRWILKLSRNSNAHLIPVGLSDSTTLARLRKRTDYDPGATIVEEFRGEDYYSTSSFVPVYKGDDAVKDLEIEEVAVLKVDVEGGELEVLEGLLSTIEANRPYIICEILPIYDETSREGRKRRTRTDKVQALLEERDYVIFRILKEGALKRVGTEIETHGDLERCEYLFLPEESKDQVLPEL
jgi:FkbM family methyltransferase